MNMLAILMPPAGIWLILMLDWMIFLPSKAQEETIRHTRGVYLFLSALLAIYAWLIALLFPGGPVWMRLMFPAAMTASWLGDFFNAEVPAVHKRLGGDHNALLASTIPFSLAHIAYIAGMAGYNGETIFLGGWWAAVAVVMLAIAILSWRFSIYDKAVQKRHVSLGILAYGCVIALMCAFAISGAIRFGGWWYMIAAGALLFMLSDAILGMTRLKERRIRFWNQYCWTFYLLGQCLMQAGFAMLFIPAG